MNEQVLPGAELLQSGILYHAEAGPKRSFSDIWALYDLIRCDGPTADKALEQALAFLEMRCD